MPRGRPRVPQAEQDARRKKWLAENRAHLRARARRWYGDNKEEQAAKARARYAKNPESRFRKAERLAWRKLREYSLDARRADRENGELLEAGLSVVTERELAAPLFVVKHRGQRRFEPWETL